MDYVRQSYGVGRQNAQVDSSHIQNKLTQTITYLFAALYTSGWVSFFGDIRAIAGDESQIGTGNVPGTAFYLRVLSSVHDEIGDVMLSRSQEEMKRNADLKDLIRARDVKGITVSWQEILSKWRQVDPQIVTLCLKNLRWVSWIDVSLIVNERMVNLLLEIAMQQEVYDSASQHGLSRDTAIEALENIVGKKMKPADKIQLILLLNMEKVTSQLIATPSLQAMRGTSSYDTDLAERVASLVNSVSLDIVKALDVEDLDLQTRQRADMLLQAFVPFMLRFFSDDYDEVCSTVVPCITELLQSFRKYGKAQGGLPTQYAGMLSPILDAIIAKMKYDETASWGREDEQTDEAEFQDLRKRLHSLQQIIAAIDENLYIEKLSNIVGETFQLFDSPNAELNWRDLDLAMHEMFLFGDLAVKNGGLYQKSKPSSAASERLIVMMSKMVESGKPVE